MTEGPAPAADSLGIATPEQVTLDFPIAGAGSRCLALAIDTLLLVAAMVILSLVIGAFSLLRVLRNGGWVAAIYVLLTFAVFWGYFSLFEIAWRGQTPGKRVARLRVIGVSGHPATVGQVLIRNVVRAVDVLPGIYAVGLVAMLCNRRAQRLGDWAAGTIVVHEAEAALPPPVGSAAPAALAAAVHLTAADLELLERYLLRRGDLPEAARGDLEGKIRAHLAPRLTPEAQALAAAPRGLESLAAALRASLGYGGPR